MPAYKVVLSPLWVSSTTCPMVGSVYTSATSPANAALTGAPVWAAMSMPLWVAHACSVLLYTICSPENAVMISPSAGLVSAAVGCLADPCGFAGVSVCDVCACVWAWARSSTCSGSAVTVLCSSDRSGNACCSSSFACSSVGDCCFCTVLSSLAGAKSIIAPMPNASSRHPAVTSSRWVPIKLRNVSHLSVFLDVCFIGSYLRATGIVACGRLFHT